MVIAELGLAPGTKRALRAAGVKNIEQLQRPAIELLALPGITGAVLYNVACCLHAHGLGLRTSTNLGQRTLPTEGDLEILRLRVVEGHALRDIGAIRELSPERVRQRLNMRFGLSGDPPAVVQRRRDRVHSRPEWERIIAMRLTRAAAGLPTAVLLRGFADGPLGGEAHAAVGRMKDKGLLTVDGDRVRPTAALRGMSQNPAFPVDTRRGMGSARAGQ